MGIFDGLGLTVRIRADVTGVNAALTGLGARMRTFSGEMTSVGNRMKDIGKTMSLYLTLPVEEFGRHALDVAGDYQRAMARVQAITSATGGQMGQLTDLTIRLGTTTRYTATEAANALSFMAQIGYSTTAMMTALPEVLKLAAASGMELAEATATIDNVMAGYRMRVEDVTHAIDVMIRTTTSSNTNMEELGQALKYAGPIASGAGVRFEEAAAAIGEMGNAGIQGSMAGTSLRGALSRMLNPTKQVREAMAAANVTFTDAQHHILPLANIIQQLSTHSHDAGLMMQLFGQRAGPAFSALVAMGSEALEKLTVQVEFSEGIGDRIANAFTRGWRGVTTKFGTAMEALAIMIGRSGVLSVATDAVIAVTDVVRSLAGADPILLRTAAGFAAIAASIPPLLVLVSLMIRSFGAIFGALAGPAGILAALIGIAIAIPIWSALAAQMRGVADAARQTQAPLARMAELNEQIATAAGDAKRALQEQRNEMMRLMVVNEQSAEAQARGAEAAARARRQSYGITPGSWLDRTLPDISPQGQAAQEARARANALHATVTTQAQANYDADSQQQRQRDYDAAMTMARNAARQPGYNHAAFVRDHPTEAALLTRGNPSGTGRGAAPEFDSVDNLDLGSLGGGAHEPLPSEKRAQEIATLRLQAAAVGQTTQQMEHLKAVQDAMNESANHGEHFTQAQAEAYVTEREQLQQTIDTRRQAQELDDQRFQAFADQHRQIVEQISDNEHLAEAAGHGARAYDRMSIALRLMHENSELTMNDALELATRIQASNDMLAHASEGMNRMSELAKSIGDAFASAFENAITAGGKLGDVLKSLAKDILLLVLRATVIQPLANWITGVLNGTPAPAPGGSQSGGSSSGGIQGIGSFLSGLFTGHHADGGFIPAGKWGLTGERGVEAVFGGRTGATVIPNHAIGGAPHFVYSPVYNFDGATAREIAVIRQQAANDRAAFDVKTRSIVADMRQRGRL